MNAAVNRLRARIAEMLPYLAWVSFVLALTGGVLLPGTPAGKNISHFLDGITWSWVPVFAFCAAVFLAGHDIVRDLIPDRFAVFTAAWAPTIAASVDGDIARWVSGFSEWVAGWSVDRLERLTGLFDPTAVTALALGLAFVIARRVMKDRKGATRTHGGGGH